MAINRPAFEKAVRDLSPLSPEKVESLFGGVTVENREMVWRFLNLPPKQQMIIAQAFAATVHFAPEVRVASVRAI